MDKKLVSRDYLVTISSPWESQGTPGTALELAIWMAKRLREISKNIVQNGDSNRHKRGFERGSLWGTPRVHTVFTSTPRSVYHQPVSRGQPSGLQTPTVPLKITNKIDFGPIWGPFKVYPVNDAVRWGARLATVRRQFVGLGRSTAAQIPLMSCLSIRAISGGIRWSCIDLHWARAISV